MSKSNVGLLHPGEMGVSIGASAKQAGHSVFWVSEGRSAETRERAGLSELDELAALPQLCSQVDIILSVCPPHAAENVLESVIANHYAGIFVDANAISPQKSRRLAARCDETEISYVDGGIVGGPAWNPNSTFLYLCGEKAPVVADLFDQGLLETELLGPEIGRASALKMCFAAYSKGSTALVSMILAAANSLAVHEELMQLWSYDGSEFADQAQSRARRVTRKAWRFAGEMDEIAETFAGVGLPDGFHRAAGEIYERISHYKGRESLPELRDVIQALLSSDNQL